MSQSESLGSTAASDAITFEHKKRVVQTTVIRKSYTVVLETGEDGWIVVRCPDLPGVVTQGKTTDEAVRNAIDAIELMLEELGHDKEFNLIVTRKTGA